MLWFHKSFVGDDIKFDPDPLPTYIDHTSFPGSFLINSILYSRFILFYIYIDFILFHKTISNQFQMESSFHPPGFNHKINIEEEQYYS